MLKRGCKSIWAVGPVGALIVVLVIVALFANLNIGASPVLSVTVRTGGALIFNGKEIDYCVYSNGRVKEVSDFTYYATPSYRVDENYPTARVTLIDNRSDEQLDSGNEVERVKKILSLLQEKNRVMPNIGSIYTIDSHYYFDVFLPSDNNNDNSFVSELYEYDYISDSISKITSFRNKFIEHVQPIDESDE